MPISAQCPACRAAFNLADELAGKVVRCSACSETFRVPMLPPPLPDEAPLVAVLVDEPPAAEGAYRVREDPQIRPAPVPRPQKGSKRALPEQPPPPPLTSPSPWRDVVVNTAAVVAVLLLILFLGFIIAAINSAGHNLDARAANPIPEQFNAPPFNPPANPPPFNPPVKRN